MKFGKKVVGLVAATMALGIGTTQVFAATYQTINTTNGQYVLIPASEFNSITTTTPTVSTPVATPAPAVSTPVATPTPVVNTPQVSTPQGATISIERAKQIAQAKAPGATLWKIHPDYEHGRLVYEVELRNGYIEYSMDIDATTGAIYDYEVDYD